MGLFDFLKKRTLNDNFKMDIVEVAKNLGDEVLHLSPDQTELNCFNAVRAMHIADGTHTLELSASIRQLPNELIKFIWSCAHAFHDFEVERGVLSCINAGLAAGGIFTRMWGGLWLFIEQDIDSGILSVKFTIFDVEKNNGINI